MEELMKKVSSVVVPVLVMFALIAAVLAAGATMAADKIPSISPGELKKLIESKSADILVVDNQPKSAYVLGHVPGAINFPWQVEIKGPVSLPRDKTLIIYCACSHEEDANDTAEQLMGQFGYTKVKLLEGGWIEWMKLNYPIEK
jgi:3-mercaptopyruvate sulfurtransferase SseA